MGIPTHRFIKIVGGYFVTDSETESFGMTVLKDEYKKEQERKEGALMEEYNKVF